MSGDRAPHGDLEVYRSTGVECALKLFWSIRSDFTIKQSHYSSLLFVRSMDDWTACK